MKLIISLLPSVRAVFPTAPFQQGKGGCCPEWTELQMITLWGSITSAACEHGLLVK